MKPYFSATEHHVHRPRVATASSLIVFSMNLSRLTGIFLIVINENTGSGKKPIRTEKWQSQQYQELRQIADFKVEKSRIAVTRGGSNRYQTREANTMRIIHGGWTTSTPFQIRIW